MRSFRMTEDLVNKTNPDKPRVAMIASGDVFGGAERQLFTLCRSGAPYFQSIIFQSLPGPLAKEAAREGIEVRKELIGQGMLSQGRTLSRALFEEHIDIVHVHGYRGSVLAALAAVFGSARPVVRTVHGAPEHPASIKMQLYVHLGDISAKLCGAHSVYVSEELKGRLNVQSSHAHTIHNGIHCEAARPGRPLEYADKPVNLAIVGRLEPVKNIACAISALACEETPKEAHLHIVGDGPLRSALRAQADELGLGEKVHFHGFRSDALGFIAHADALLLPSLHEGVPYVLLEAMNLRVVPIASKVGGIPEVATHLQDAYLLDAPKAETMATAIRVIVRNVALRAELAKNAQLRVQQAFSAETMARQYSELYRRVKRA